jgi:hypothetical protein
MNFIERAVLWLFGFGQGDLGDSSRWSLEFMNPIAGWILFMLIIPAVGYYAWTLYRREQGFLNRARRALLLGLRLAAFAVLLMILLQPVVSMDLQTTLRGTILVMVDDSKSMSVIDEQLTPEEIEGLSGLTRLTTREIAGKNRLDLVKAWLAATELKLYVRENDLIFYRFSTKLERMDQPAALSPEGPSTRTGDAILQALKEVRGRHVNAVLVITDGRSNTGTTLAYVADSLKGRERGIPVHTVGVGSDRPPQDLRIVRLMAEPVVLLNDDVTFEFEIDQTGYEGRRVRVQLTDGKRTYDTKDVTLKAGGRIKSSLSLKADKAGEFQYTVRVDDLPGETSKDNNAQSQTVLVMDKRVKVLFVEGRPRSEYIFLKSSLIRDDKLQAYCYLTSADPNFKQELSLDLMRQGEPGLSQFPADRKELQKFDVIIVGDVDLRTLGDPKRATDSAQNWRKIGETLQWFVEDLGGAIVFLGGHEYNPWQYRDTPFEKLLPVQIPTTNPMQQRVFKEPFKPKLTAHGRDEPMLRLKPDPDENQKYWQDKDGLPPLYWYTPVRDAKPGARVQMKHPDGSILMASQIVGRGRTLFFGTDETWRWREYTRDKTYYKLWGTIIQRMRVGKLSRSKRYTLTVKPNYWLGERVEIEAHVFDDAMQPLRQPTVTAEVVHPDDKREKIELRAIADRPGYYAGGFEPPSEGSYKVRMGPSEKPDEWTLETFTVKVPVLEFENVSMDRAALESLSLATGGRFYKLSEVSRLLEDLKKGKALPPIKESRERELWDTPLVFMMFLCFIVVEWALRKRWGLA